MNWIKGSSIIQAVLGIGEWVKGSRIISSIVKSGRESKVVSSIYRYAPKENIPLLTSSIFSEKGDMSNKVLNENAKSLLECKYLKWFRNSFFVSLVITFLECEKDDRIA